MEQENEVLRRLRLGSELAIQLPAHSLALTATPPNQTMLARSDEAGRTQQAGMSEIAEAVAPPLFIGLTDCRCTS